jgi:hypothetical protein
MIKGEKHMNDRSSHELTRGKMISLRLCLGTTLLMSPLVVLAQSNAVTGKLEGQTKTVRIWDACDPKTFNAAVGPGTCEAGHHGETKFEDFFGELQLDKIAGAWRFNPLLDTTEGKLKLVRLDLNPGEQISLQNVGGETHTFTKVKKVCWRIFCSVEPSDGQSGSGARVRPGAS